MAALLLPWLHAAFAGLKLDCTRRAWLNGTILVPTAQAFSGLQTVSTSSSSKSMPCTGCRGCKAMRGSWRSSALLRCSAVVAAAHDDGLVEGVAYEVVRPPYMLWHIRVPISGCTPGHLERMILASIDLHHHVQVCAAGLADNARATQPCYEHQKPQAAAATAAVSAHCTTSSPLKDLKRATHVKAYLAQAHSHAHTCRQSNAKHTCLLPRLPPAVPSLPATGSANKSRPRTSAPVAALPLPPDCDAASVCSAAGC